MPPLESEFRNIRRSKYVKKSAKDIKELAKSEGISLSEIYDSLQKSIIAARAIKKKYTRVASKNRKVTRDLSNNLTNMIVEQPIKPERMVSVSMRVFREDTRNTKRNSDTTINGRLWVAHEYIESRDYEGRPEYYLGEANTSSLTLPFTFIQPYANRMMKIELGDRVIRKRNGIMDQEDNTRLTEFLNSIERLGQEEFASYVKSIHEHYAVILIIEGYESISSSYYKDLPPVNKIRLLDDDTRMSHRHLDYEINKDALSLRDLFKPEKYYMPNACLPTAIMNTIADSYNSKYKLKPRVTFELLWKLVYPNKPFDSSLDFPLSFDEAIPIFEYFGVCAKQYNTNDELESSFAPERLNQNIIRDIVYIRKDNHAFGIYNQTVKKTIVRSTPKTDKLVVSDRYPIPSGKSVLTGCVTNTNDLMEQIIANVKNLELKEEDEVKMIKFLWCSPTDLSDILKYMVVDCKFYPTITTNSYKQVLSFGFKVQNLIVTLARPSFGRETIVTKDMVCLETQTAMVYQTVKEKAMKDMLNPYFKSSYGEGFAEMLSCYNRPALSGKMIQGYKGGVIALDTIKCYPSIVKNLSKIPVFSQFDVFTKDDGSVIHDHTLYKVKLIGKVDSDRSTRSKILMNLKEDVIYGFIVKLIRDEIKVVASCNPHKIVNNPLGKVIEDVLALKNDNMTESLKKQILVSCIGMFGKQNAYSCLPKIFVTYEDAQRESEKMPGGFIQRLGIGDGWLDPKTLIRHFKQSLYILTYTVSKKLIDGFLPIQHLIYDTCRVNLAMAAEMAENAGCQVLGVKTDAVYISTDDSDKLPLMPWKHDIDGCNIKNIGKLKKEAGTLPDKKLIDKQGTAGVGDIWIQPSPEVITYTLEDEYSSEEFTEIFNTYNRIMVKSKHAGGGKSYSLKQYVKGTNHVIACPSNSQSRKLQLEGFNGVTIYDLCGMRPTDDGRIERAGGVIEEYEFVGIEEVGQLNTKEWCMLNRYMTMFPNAKYICNGDCVQNNPIENDLNPALRKSIYYESIMKRMFPHQIMLEIPKRYRAEQVERVKQLRYDLFINKLDISVIIDKYAKPVMTLDDIPQDVSFITYLQDSRKTINEWEHRRRGLYGVTVGTLLRANCHMGKGKNTRINKHFEYKVTRVSDKEFDMIDESSNLEYKNVNKKWLYNFSYPYAFTGHSLQGDTIDRPIVIFDTSSQYVNRKWLYVALTRSSDLDKVYVYKGSLVDARMSIMDVENKINGYIRQDMSAGRGYDMKHYVDIAWVMRQSRHQMHRCSHCAEVMNMKNNGGDMDWTIDRCDNDLGHIKDN